MKNIKDLSLKITFPVALGIAAIIILALPTILTVRVTKSRALEDASEQARLSALNAGNHLIGVINEKTSLIRAYSYLAEEIVLSDIIPDEKKREHTLQDMDRLVKEKRLDNIWCIFEPDALDRLDTLFVNHTGSTAGGIFTPRLTEKDGIVKVETMGSHYDALYYSQTRKSGHEIITKPYWTELDGKKVFVFSFCFPLFVNNHFIGVMGTDIRVEDVNKALKNNERTDQSVIARLITDGGIIVADPDTSKIGQPIGNGNEIADRLAKGEIFEGLYPENGEMMFKVYVPIKLDEGTAPWFYTMSIPKDVVYKDVNQFRRYMILLNILSSIVVFIVIFLMSRNLIGWITRLTGNIHDLSLGKLDSDFDLSLGENEIGRMSEELKSLAGSLKHTAAFAHEIGEGNLDAAFTPLSDSDTLGNALIEMQGNLRKVRKEEEKYKQDEKHRNWGTTGLARFAEILRKDNNDIEALSYNIISNLVKYLDANQGGIFILNDENTEPYLELKASYAFDRRKYSEKMIHPGEGLVGTSYLEGEPIYITDLPHDYIRIVSGLGGDTPRALFILPLKVNDEIYGVIEIASFTPFEPYQLEFIERLGESVAATISTVRTNMKTNTLLEQTKLQAEEMINQEEELRQNMEEMQATQEEMRRRESELTETLTQVNELQKENRKKGLEFDQLFGSIKNSFHVIEFSVDGHLTDVNDNVLNAHHLPKEAFIGKPLGDFVQEPEAEMKKLFDNLLHGITQSKQQEVTANGKSTLFNHEFIPLVDADGKVYKIILLAYPA